MSKRKDKILHTRLTEEDYNRLKKEAEKNYISSYEIFIIS